MGLDDVGRLAVVSPHCDDGVFGCGELLALHPGSVVITVFTAYPRPDEPLTVWDEARRRSRMRAPTPSASRSGCSTAIIT
jgi:hypothetical protein